MVNAQQCTVLVRTEADNTGESGEEGGETDALIKKSKTAPGRMSMLRSARQETAKFADWAANFFSADYNFKWGRVMLRGEDAP